MATSAVTLALLTSAQAQRPIPRAKPSQDPPAATQQGKPSDDDAFRKYFAMGYNYCDAMVLAAFWNEASPGEAKLRLGHKMLDFGAEEGDIHLREARAEAFKKPTEEMPCWYTDGGYTFDDAALLGKYWGTGIADSKGRMTSLLVGGHDIVIKKALKSAKGR
jgi:hypothetical protein